MTADTELDELAGAYEDEFPFALDNRLVLDRIVERVIALADDLPGDASLLDFGLGRGDSACRLSERFPRYVLVEGSEEVVRRFRERFPERAKGVEVKVAFFEAFDTDETFDLVVMGFILEHVEDPALVLRRARRFLKPGGKVVAAVPNYEALNKRYGHAAGMLEDMSRLSDADRALGHRRLFNVESLTRLAETSGYTVRRTEGIFLKPITTEQMKTLKLPEAILRAMLVVGTDYPELCTAILAVLDPAEGGGTA